jgi:glycosyltransferase involved in cell wall biosynthesis
MSSKDQSNLFVSVIIPVLNDSKRLKTCLESLEKQTYPKNKYEVIVVDNDSTENITNIVNGFEQSFTAFESQPGSYVARNKGISLAKGEILAFTDSDCIPSVDWIEQGVTNILSIPNCGLVAGKIEFFFLNSQKLTPVELYESIEVSFNQEANIKDHHYGVTANLFTFKEVINSVGPFDSAIKSGGDRLWGEKVFQAGYQQAYVDNVCVKHPARNSFSQLYKRTARFVGGEYDLMMRKKYSPLEIFMDFIGAIKPPFRIFYRIWKNQRLTGNKQKIQFTFVMLFTKYVVIVEKIRLYLGGISRRE